MTAQLLPEMGRRIFEPLAERVDNCAAPQPVSPDELPELLTACEFGAKAIEALGEILRATLQRGIEKKTFKVMHENVSAIVANALERIFPKVTAMLAVDTAPKEDLPGRRARLEVCVVAASKVRAELDTMKTWLNAPRPKIDPAVLARGEFPDDYAGYIDEKAVAARLDAGGNF